MANSPDSPSRASSSSQLVLVFAPGLWPFRSQMDRVSWFIGQGIATGLSQVPDLVGYASPRGLIDPLGADPARHKAIRVYRSLPPISVIRQESEALGASMAITGRLLVDSQGVEIWLNLIEAPSGHLLWTRSINPSREKLLWQLVGLLRRLVDAMGEYASERIVLSDVFPTGSWEALVAHARAQDVCLGWTGDLARGIEAMRLVSRAVALDPGFTSAQQLFSELGRSLLDSATTLEQCDQIRNALAGTSDVGSIRDMLQLAHNRMLALAKGGQQT